MDEQLKVLIVDDEWIIRDGLKSFPWEEYDCMVAGEAEDGSEGLLLARVLLPDIILSDIKMPEMDGLAFAQKAKEANPDVEIILLTGYDSFDFAQTAIRYGISDYLLKPTNFNEMKQAVGKLCNKIKEREKRKKFYQDLAKKYENALPLLINKLTDDLLRGKLKGRDDVEKKLKLFDLKIEKYIILSAQLDADKSSLEHMDIEPWLMEFGIANICEEIFKQYCERVLIDCDVSSFNFILSYPRHSSDTDCLALCTQSCMKIQKAISDYIGQNLCFGISNVGADVYQMNRYWRQAYEACQQSVFFGGQCIIEFSDIQSLQKDTWVIPEGEKQNLFDAVSSGNRAGIEQFMDMLACEISKNAVDIDSVRSTMLELVIGSLRVSEKMSTLKIKTHLPTVYNGIESIYVSDTIERLVAIVKEVFLILAKQNEQKSIDFHKQVVDEIITYIQSHYEQDLSLDMMSEMFQMSSPYISRLIKKNTQKNFMDILLDVRMEKAKQLIHSGKYKIYEIAEKVGYHDFSYFIQVFKKKYGITPKEYKNII